MRISLSPSDFQKIPFPMRQALLFLASSRGWFFSPKLPTAEIQVRYEARKDALLFSPPGTITENFFELPATVVQEMADRLFFSSHERLPGESEPASPSVDRISLKVETEFLRQVLRMRIPFVKKCLWPGGHPFALALTHDVDLTRRTGWKSIFSSLATGRLKTFGGQVKEKISGENPYWTFPRLLSLYEALGWSATFFFLSRSWEGFSYRYNLRHPRFLQLLRQLNAQGHEVGLHSSLRASGNPKFIAQEKRRLEQILGADVPGVRQHFLRLRFPQAWEHFTTAGFSYDSSSGFNEKPGFKSGTSFPYKTINAEGSEALPLDEIPFQVMDYALVRGSRSSDDAWRLFTRIANEVKETGGILNILWHPSNLAEPEYAPLWERITGWISQQRLYPESLTRLQTRWKYVRQVELISYRERGEDFELILSSAHPVSAFCLEVVLPPETQLSVSEPFRVRRITDQRIFIEIDQLSPGETKLSLRISNQANTKK